MKRVCVFTGSRSEYGLLRPLLFDITKADSMELQLIASGMHLSPEFGLTYRAIEEDGFHIDEKIEILMSSDSEIGISKSFGLGVISFSEALSRLKPDIAIILGDRYEALAFAISCTIAKIPIAHIHGGELTTGAMDEAFRHSISKMSFLHFTSTDEYRKRVIQLGESPERVFNVGAIGLENLKQIPLLSKDEFEKKIGLKLNKKNLLITFHPVTLEKNTSEAQFAELLTSIDDIEDTNIIFTKPNSDTYGRIISRMIDRYAEEHPHNTVVFTSMGQELYLSTLQFVDAVVGNSSSGIIEAPSFKIGTVNIGDRQKGRVAASSVIHCEPSAADVSRAFDLLYSDSFQNELPSTINPYERKNTCKTILETIRTVSLSDAAKKSFYHFA